MGFLITDETLNLYLTGVTHWDGGTLDQPTQAYQWQPGPKGQDVPAWQINCWI